MSNKKILSIEEIAKIVKICKKNKKRVVLCHGVFDLLHIGHIKHFEKAKKNGDILIVTITADEYVNKGPNRPQFTTSLRAESLAAIQFIDYVSISYFPTAINIIKKIKPNIYFKGLEYKNEKVIDEKNGCASIEICFRRSSHEALQLDRPPDERFLFFEHIRKNQERKGNDTALKKCGCPNSPTGHHTNCHIAHTKPNPE